MGKNVEDVNHIIDTDLGSGVTVHRLMSESHTDLTPTEHADLRDNAATQQAFDSWWAQRPTAQAAWYAARSTAWKAQARAHVLLFET